MNKIQIGNLELYEHFTLEGVTVFFCANNSNYYYSYYKEGSLGVTGEFEDSTEAWEMGWRSLLGVL